MVRQMERGSVREEGNMTWENITMAGEMEEEAIVEYDDYGRNYQEFFDFEGVFFFLLGILGGVLVVVLGLILVQQGKVRHRTLHRPRK